MLKQGFTSIQNKFIVYIHLSKNYTKTFFQFDFILNHTLKKCQTVLLSVYRSLNQILARFSSTHLH